MVYDPTQWNQFFVMVGGGAAALTGLVFVAMSLNVDRITHDAKHRFRAIGTLSGFLGVFAICALVLMAGQSPQAVGIEWTVVAILAGLVVLNGYIQAIRLGGTEARRLDRVIVGMGLYLGQIVGAALLWAGHLIGLYVASVAMTACLVFLTSGAWLLIVGVVRERSGN
jgi:hypothetical protein